LAFPLLLLWHLLHSDEHQPPRLQLRLRGWPQRRHRLSGFHRPWSSYGFHLLLWWSCLHLLLWFLLRLDYWSLDRGWLLWRRGCRK
jgi:hypothetical protein